MLELKDIQLTLGERKILNNLSLSVKAGETVGIIGPNGSGKTTLFNVISGFLQQNSGTLEFVGQDISHMSPHERARLGLARVFQNFGVFRDLTLLENIQLAIESKQPLLRTLFPFQKQSRINRDAALDYLDLIKLRDKALNKSSSLSGGQLRLLEIIRAIAFKAELFLMDEPTAGVSPRMKSDIISQIDELKKQKKTIIVIEHDMGFIRAFCDRIIVIDQGQIALDGTPDEIQNDQRLQDIYFGTKAA